MAKWPYTTRRWQRLRRMKLRQNPLCELCLKVGEFEVATAVDHVVAIKAGGEVYPSLEGLASLCDSCHNRKTRAEQLGRAPPPKVVTGCDADGRPRNLNPCYRT